GRGTAAIRVTPSDNPSTLLAELNVFDETGTLAGTGIALGGGVIGLDVTDVIPGQRFYLQIRGNGGSEGAYTVSVSGLPEVDDVADAGKWDKATDIPVRDFLGEGSIDGTIESAGDTDAFRFRASSFANVTIDVTQISNTMDPVVTIYEVSEDPSGNPIWLRIGFNDDLDANTVDSRVIVPVAPIRFFDNDPAGLGDEDRLYPYYYVVVQGKDPLATFGDYTLTVTFPPTDDHADGDTDLDGIIDTGEFDIATRIVIDSATGGGEDTGTIGTVLDTDLFVFAAPASGPASIIISRPEGSTILPQVSIVAADGTVLATGAGGDALFFFFAEASLDVVRGQDLYIVVAGLVDDANPDLVTNLGDYTVSVTAPPIDDYPNAGEFDLAAAVVLNANTGIGQIGGSAANDPSNARLSPNGDTDLFTFVALAAGNVAIQVTPYSSGVGQFGPRIRIFDSTFVLISDTSAATNLETVLTNLTATAVGERFYVLVSPTEGLTGSTSTGEYQLRVTGQVGTGGGGGDPADVDFNNPGVVSLNPRTGDGEISSNIEVNRDRDLYTFTTLAAGRVFVQLIAPDGSILRASLQVLNQANENVGSQVALDSAGIPGAIANVAFDSAAGVTYYIIVDGLSNSTGSYRLVINTQPVVNRLYFPEGFSNRSIREFVSIVNPNAVDVSYTVYLKYESSLIPDTV
ncbi:MAG: hypothetical protein PSX37_13315, partial [bacterium]|nr:hypothetical protein [bacterium]